MLLEAGKRKELNQQNTETLLLNPVLSELSLSQFQPFLSFNQASCRFRTEFAFGK